jgi:hypothetical protein
MTLWLLATGCSCPPAPNFDQIFALDGTRGPPFSVGEGGAGDAGGDAADSGDTEDPQAIDCSPAAAACVPGGPCLAACQCVIRRDQVGHVNIEACTLLADTAAPSVEVRYAIVNPCGCPVFGGGCSAAE